MSRSPFIRIALILVTLAAWLTACGGGRGVRLTAIAPQPTPANQATSPQKSPTAVAAPTEAQPAASHSASNESADQALQQLDGDLGRADTLPDLKDTPGADVDQALQQLDQSLSTTDTLNDLAK